jgi:hypothetical protein
MTNRMRKATRDVFRMSTWAAVAVALYFLTFDFGLQETHPGLQATIYTAANITMRAWLGYWIARQALGRLKMDGTENPTKLLARAVLIGAVVLTSR